MTNFTGADAIGWIESFCRIPKGPAVGQPVKLIEYQREILGGIFDTPTRRALISMGRQNAKTTLSAYLLLLHLAGPRHQRNGLLVSSALTREQAAILFDAAAKIVRLSPELAATVDVVEFQKTLRCPELGTVYRALSADAPTQLGLSPFFVCHDELGAVVGPFSKLYDVLESGGAAQAEPLSVIISTQARSDTDLLSRLIDDAATGADVRAIAFDRYNMKFLKPCLVRAGFTEQELTRFVEHGQGFLGMSPSIRELETRLLQKSLKHGLHPILTMCASNAAVVVDDAENRKFTKKKSTGRIDALVALAMAVGAMPLAAQGEVGTLEGWLASAT